MATVSRVKPCLFTEGRREACRWRTGGGHAPNILTVAARLASRMRVGVASGAIDAVAAQILRQRLTSGARCTVAARPQLAPRAGYRARSAALRLVARKHAGSWSSTIPTACMKAYTVVGPTKRKP